MNGINRIQITSAHPVNPVHPVLSSSHDEGRAVFFLYHEQHELDEWRRELGTNGGMMK